MALVCAFWGGGTRMTYGDLWGLPLFHQGQGGGAGGFRPS